jgi:hypothetical protein
MGASGSKNGNGNNNLPPSAYNINGGNENINQGQEVNGGFTNYGGTGNVRGMWDKYMAWMKNTEVAGWKKGLAGLGFIVGVIVALVIVLLILGLILWFVREVLKLFGISKFSALSGPYNSIINVKADPWCGRLFTPEYDVGCLGGGPYTYPCGFDPYARTTLDRSCGILSIGNSCSQSHCSCPKKCGCKTKCSCKRDCKCEAAGAAGAAGADKEGFMGACNTYTPGLCKLACLCDDVPCHLKAFATAERGALSVAGGYAGEGVPCPQEIQAMRDEAYGCGWKDPAAISEDAALQVLNGYSSPGSRTFPVHGQSYFTPAELNDQALSRQVGKYGLIPASKKKHN